VLVGGIVVGLVGGGLMVMMFVLVLVAFEPPNVGTGVITAGVVGGGS